VGATQDKGKWVPEQHWPSVKYPSRNATEKKEKKQDISANSLAPDDSAVLAESASR